MPPPPPEAEQRAEEQVALDMGDEYESALADATESEMVDLAGEAPITDLCHRSRAGDSEKVTSQPL